MHTTESISRDVKRERHPHMYTHSHADVPNPVPTSSRPRPPFDLLLNLARTLQSRAHLALLLAFPPFVQLVHLDRFFKFSALSNSHRCFAFESGGETSCLIPGRLVLSHVCSFLVPFLKHSIAICFRHCVVGASGPNLKPTSHQPASFLLG